MKLVDARCLVTAVHAEIGAGKGALRAKLASKLTAVKENYHSARRLQ
jgi:hypothetical protein